jgi:hypothetical protein
MVDHHDSQKRTLTLLEKDVLRPSQVFYTSIQLKETKHFGVDATLNSPADDQHYLDHVKSFLHINARI